MYDQKVINEWLEGEPIALNENGHNLVIVTKNDGKYNMYRFFVHGKQTVCSVNMQDQPADGIIKALLSIRAV